MDTGLGADSEFQSAKKALQLTDGVPLSWVDANRVIQYAVLMCMFSNRAHWNQVVDLVIEMLSLQVCRDRKIGNVQVRSPHHVLVMCTPQMRGISGGQKKTLF